MRTLVVFFTQTGKTKALAVRISKLTGADLFEIRTKKSYDISYAKTVLTSMKEILTKERPELTEEIPDCQAYDRILIGSPIWCGYVPNAVLSFMEKANLEEKRTALFTTSGGTDPMRAAVKLKKAYPACRWHSPLNGNDVTEEDLRKWLGL